jgi:hypothetical protein
MPDAGKLLASPAVVEGRAVEVSNCATPDVKDMILIRHSKFTACWKYLSCHGVYADGCRDYFSSSIPTNRSSPRIEVSVANMSQSSLHDVWLQVKSIIGDIVAMAM